MNDILGLGVKATDSNTLLLTYTIDTDPAPLVVSPEDEKANPSLASLTIAVSNTSWPKGVTCKQIQFSFYIAQDSAQSLTDTDTGIHCTSTPDSNWDISETSAGVFTATPNSSGDSLITSQGLIFQIYNIRINTTPGNALFMINEISDAAGAESGDHSGTFYLAKFPYSFYVKNYHASKPIVDNNEPVTLYWTGSVNASYSLAFSPGSPPVDVSTVRTWTSDPLTQATVFQLTVKAQVLGETLDAVLSVTVLVNQPEIEATSLKVTGDSELNTLNATGDTTLSTVKANSINTPSADITNMQLNGILAGSLTLNATLGALQNFVQITPATYQANTDGFIIGLINSASGNSEQISYGIIGARSGDLTLFATGGFIMIRYIGPSNVVSGSQYHNICLPVLKGTQWSVAFQKHSGNQVDPVYAFYWAALSNNNGQATYTKVSDTPSVTFPA